MRITVRKFPMAKVGVSLLLTCAGLGASNNAYGDSVFVTNGGSGTVGEYTTSGAPVNPSLISGLTGPYGIAVEGSDLFVSNGDVPGSLSNSVGLYSTSGAVINPALISGLDAPTGIALDGSGHIFIVNQSSLGNNGFISEYTVTGEAVNTQLITGLFVPRDIVVDGNGHIFLTTGTGAIEEYTTSGQLINSSLLSFAASGIALDGNGNMYVGSSYYDPATDGYVGNVGEYTTAGATVNASLFSGFGAPSQIELALDEEGHIFVASANSVGEYTTSGDVVNASLISGLGFQGASDLAIETTSAAAVPLPPALWTGACLLGMVGIGRLVRGRKRWAS